MQSEEFRAFWAGHGVRLHQSGYKEFLRPVGGDLRLSFDTLTFLAVKGLTLPAYSPRAQHTIRGADARTG